LHNQLAAQKGKAHPEKLSETRHSILDFRNPGFFKKLGFFTIFFEGRCGFLE